MPTYHVGSTPQFQRSVQALDRSARGEVYDAAMKVAHGNPSVHVHKLQGCDYVSFGVNRNALRVICLREADLLILLHVGAHDDAYDWAIRHRTVRVGDVVKFVDVATEAADRPTGDASRPKGPLADIRERVFARFGIGAHAARVLQRAASDDEVIELAEQLKYPVCHAVLSLATDPDDLATIQRTFEASLRNPEPTVPPSLAEALRSEVNAGTVWLSASERALREAMDGDLADWRLFLHPAQRRLVRWRVGGAIKVTGGPGTGKTVVALHRTRFLAEHRFPDDPRPVLLSTFSATLQAQLSELVDGLCEDVPDLRARIDTRTLTDVAQEVLRRAGTPHRLASSEVIDACWRDALQHDTIGWSKASYRAERTHVVARGGAWSEDRYLAAVRTGRSTRLDRARKRAVWAVLAEFEAALARSGAADSIALARDASAVVASGAVPSPWCAAVVDEVQDASAAQLRLLGTLARDPDSGAIGADRLFLCGDGYQRLYAAPVSLAACGIEVRGRSRRLRLNYRTTEGIRRAAIEVVEGMDLDDLEQLGPADDTPFDGYRSARGGPPPQMVRLDDLPAEAAWIASNAAPSLLVLVRAASYRDQLAEHLRHVGCAVHVLEGRGSVAPAGITLCTLHRAKGLEAPRVVIAGGQGIPARFPGGDDADRRLHERSEQCLLYVGMTRARDWCAVTRVGAPGG